MWGQRCAQHRPPLEMPLSLEPLPCPISHPFLLLHSQPAKERPIIPTRLSPAAHSNPLPYLARRSSASHASPCSAPTSHSCNAIFYTATPTSSPCGRGAANNRLIMQAHQQYPKEVPLTIQPIGQQ
jgi:hypothetical protein